MPRFFKGLTIAVLMIAGAALAIVAPTGVLYFAGCGEPAGAKYAKRAFSYHDDTPQQKEAVTTQQEATVATTQGIELAMIQNADAAKAIGEAKRQLLIEPPQVTPAKNAIDAGAKTLVEQRSTLQKALDLANGVIASQQKTIAALGDQVGINEQLRSEGVANGTQIASLTTINEKFEKQDQDVFGKARRAWHNFQRDILIFLVVGVPLLIVLGVLGVRYGADKITRPAADGIGMVGGWIVGGIRWFGYYAGTFILAIVPFVGHIFDEVANDARSAIQKLEGKKTATPVSQSGVEVSK